MKNRCAALLIGLCSLGAVPAVGQALGHSAAPAGLLPCIDLPLLGKLLCGLLPI